MFVFKERRCCKVCFMRNTHPCGARKDREPQAELRWGKTSACLSKMQDTTSFLNLRCAWLESGSTQKDKGESALFSSHEIILTSLYMSRMNLNSFKSAQTLDCSMQLLSHSQAGASISFLTIYILMLKRQSLRIKRCLKGIKPQH